MVDKLEEKQKPTKPTKPTKSTKPIKSTKSISIQLQKPFLKWIGGKTQIIDTVLKYVPLEMDNYHELFLGGGSVLLAVLTLQKHNKIIIKNKIYASDLNKELINLYKNIQTNKEELFKYITKYIDEYDIVGALIPQPTESGIASKESYYYWLRTKFNTMDKNTIEYSALFLFLNKTCFRGMYREGPNGFNVPYGHYKKTPTIISKSELDKISELIKDVEFSCCDFSNSIKNVKKGDYVYLDPPYVPENEKSFVGYTINGFNLDTHNKLFAEIAKLNEDEIKFSLSNAKVKLVIDAFPNYKCEDILARRAINSKKPGSITTEIIISN